MTNAADDQLMTSTQQVATTEANIDTVSRWVTEATRGRLTFVPALDNDGSFHSLRLAGGSWIGVERNQPITGVGFRLYVSPFRKLTNRNRADMAQVVIQLRQVAATLRTFGFEDLWLELNIDADRFARRHHLAGAR